MSRDDQSIHILKKLVVDGLLLAVLLVCLSVTSLVWEPFQRGFFCADETLMFPYYDDTVTVPMLRSVGLALPICTMLICEWALLRKEQDDQRCFGIRIPVWMRGFYCTLASFGIGTCFIELACNIAKNTIGRLRPHFFDVCRPSIDCGAAEWRGRYIQPHEYRCTGDTPDRFTDMRRSFLSGHSAWAAYTMIYFALYLHSRMSWRGTRILRHALQFAAVMLSWYTALSRVSDFKHHWSDVLAGYSMGAIFAVVMWTWGTDLVQKKKNHTPLPQFDISLSNQQTT